MKLGVMNPLLSQEPVRGQTRELLDDILAEGSDGPAPGYLGRRRRQLWSSIESHAPLLSQKGQRSVKRFRR